MRNNKRLLAMAIASALAAPMSAFATNGMNLEGYGPVATAMGGASMAYDNGTAAMMNNPATLGLMGEGSRLDVAVGVLGPDVTANSGANMGNMDAKSGGDSYTMPAIGWATSRGQLTYGVGIFSQGGMGTEYASDSFMSMGTGQDARSELGVGRLMFPVAFKVNDQLTVGGSLDYVWGGLDMKMAMPIYDTPTTTNAVPGTLADFSTGFGGNQVLGTVTMSTGLQTAIGSAMGMSYDTVAINFSDSNDFTQEASGAGFGAKLGLTYKVNNQLSFGAAYHLKTAMDDWEGDASMVLYDVDGTSPSQALTGKMTVKDFQWPATIAAGMAYTPNDRWMVAADVKVLQWSDVMKDFTMVFDADANSTFGVSNTDNASFTIYQDWDDQTVVSIGGAYMVNDALTLRAGANLASNPIPDNYVHPLFPATVENHYTAGFGYVMNQASSVNFALTYAPEVDVTNSNTGMKISHSQTNWQLMYSHRF